jgi:hypothetical protein
MKPAMYAGGAAMQVESPPLALCLARRKGVRV